VARKYIKDPQLLRFIDVECYIWSTVSAELTPMINAGGWVAGVLGGSGGGWEEQASGRTSSQRPVHAPVVYIQGLDPQLNAGDWVGCEGWGGKACSREQRDGEAGGGLGLH
jgi:hypothetical protein